jgi:hypothetical protein
MRSSISSSSRSPPITKRKLVFVSASKYKGKKFVCDVVSKPKSKPPHRRYPICRFVMQEKIRYKI